MDVVENVIEDKATALIETGVDFQIIDHQTQAENTRMGKAQAALENAIESGDQVRIDAAQKEYDDANSALLNDDGSGVIQ